MAKIELKGTIVEVGKEQTFTGAEAKKDLRKQIVIFRVPPYRDEFGEERGKEEFWQMEVIGSNIDTLKLTAEMEQKKAIATCYVNSTLLVGTANKTGKDMFIINCVLWKLELKS